MALKLHWTGTWVEALVWDNLLQWAGSTDYQKLLAALDLAQVLE